VLFEKQLPVEEKAQIAPNGLGAEGGSPSVWGVSKVDGEGTKAPAPGEVEDLGLVVFKDKP
jgi:hypothetical protein